MPRNLERYRHRVIQEASAAATAASVAASDPHATTSHQAQLDAAKELARLRAMSQHPKPLPGSTAPTDPWHGTGTVPGSESMFRPNPRTGASARDAPIDVSSDPTLYQGYNYCPAARRSDVTPDWLTRRVPSFHNLDFSIYQAPVTNIKEAVANPNTPSVPVTRSGNL